MLEDTHVHNIMTSVLNVHTIKLHDLCSTGGPVYRPLVLTKFKDFLFNDINISGPFPLYSRADHIAQDDQRPALHSIQENSEYI